MPLALLYNRTDDGQGSRDIRKALAGTSYIYEGGCTQLLIRWNMRTSLFRADAAVGILGAHVWAASDAPVSIPLSFLVDQNVILAVLPNCSLPSDLKTPIDLLDVGWFELRRELLEKLLFLYLVQDSHAGGRWGANQVIGRTPDKRSALLPVGFKTETC